LDDIKSSVWNFNVDPEIKTHGLEDRRLDGALTGLEVRRD